MTSRTESFLARKRKSAIMQWKRQFPVALSRRPIRRFSLFPRVPHTVLWCARATRAKINPRVEKVFRGEVGTLRMLHPHDSMGIRFECVRRPSLFLPTPGCAFNRSAFAHFRPVNRLCLRVYVPAERALFVHRVSSKSRRISRKQIESSTAVSISIFSSTRLLLFVHYL